MESKLAISCRMMHNLIKIHHTVKSYEEFHRLMDVWTHTALCAHLRLVQYCLNTCFTGTDESECYERKDSSTSGNSGKVCELVKGCSQS